MIVMSTCQNAVPMPRSSSAACMRSGIVRNSDTARTNDPIGAKHESIGDCA